MNDLNVARDNRTAYEYCRDNGHLEFVAKAAECDGYTSGEGQWAPKIVAKLKRKGKPHLTINKILPTFATLSGEHIARRGDISFRAGANGSPDTAATLDKLWINFAQSQRLDWVEGMAFWDGVIRSRGFLDLRVSFDDAMRGEPVVTYLNSKDVMLFPGDHGMDPDLWTGVMTTRWLSSVDIAEIYGVKLKEIAQFADTTGMDTDYVDWERDSFGRPLYDQHSIDEKQRAKYRLLRVLERQEWEYKTAECFVSPETGEVREIPQGWDRERIQMAIMEYDYSTIRKRVRKIRWVATAGDLVLHNDISPMRHFTPIPYFPFLIGGRTVGVVEHLRGAQDLLNKSLSQELHIVAGIANSGWKVKKNSMGNMTTEQLQERGGEDGIVIELINNVEDIQKIAPNQVPTGIDRLSYKAGEAIQEISLVSDSMQGLDRADVSAAAIDKKSSQGTAALAPIYTALDETRRILARNWLDLTQQFITEERVYYITNNKSKKAEQEQVAVNQEQPDGSILNDLTIGEYGLVISNVKSRNSFDMEQFQLMVDMVRLGAPLPWSEVVDTLTILSNKDRIVEQMKKVEGSGEPTQAEQQAQQLEQRLQAAQAADKESSAEVKKAQAQKVMLETQKAAQGGDGEREAAAKIQMEGMKAMQDLKMKEEANRMKAEQQRRDQEAKDISLMSTVQQQEQQAQRDREASQLKISAQNMEAQLKAEKMQAELAFIRAKNALELEALRAKIEADKQAAMVAQESAKELAAIKAKQAAAQPENNVVRDNKTP